MLFPYWKRLDDFETLYFKGMTTQIFIPSLERPLKMLFLSAVTVHLHSSRDIVINAILVFESGVLKKL